ncbi:MAG: TrkH family potassium uptake protein [Bacteroidales bacterium]
MRTRIRLLFRLRELALVTVRIVTRMLETGMVLTGLFALFLLVYEFGFSQTEDSRLFTEHAQNILLLLFLSGQTLRFLLCMKEIFLESGKWFEISLFLANSAIWSINTHYFDTLSLSAPWLTWLSAELLTPLLLLTLSLIYLSRAFFNWMGKIVNPALLFAGSFLFIIVAGSGLLMLPKATYSGISYLDSLFVATSAVCVTGLTTVDIPTVFTQGGQLIILILFQIGGIGVMTFTSFLAMPFLGGASMTNTMTLREILQENRADSLFGTLRSIILITLSAECIGAVAIWTEIEGTLGTPREELFFSVFHAISAFCNAGFSTISNGLSHPLLQHNYSLLIWISLLIIIGGIGFPIINNYYQLIRHVLNNGIEQLKGISTTYRHQPQVINLNTRIVLVTTILLLVTGFLLFFLFERNGVLKGMPLNGQLATAFFGSVTPRTAGFSSFSISALHPSTLFLYLTLMWIGASPMSTGGGIKTTTVAVLFMDMFHAAQQKPHVTLWNRQISTSTVRKAIAIVTATTVWFVAASMALIISEPQAPLVSILFETISALSTVGLSADLTPTLGNAGKIIILVTMYIGRVGAFVLLTTFLPVKSGDFIRYPKDQLIM